MSLDAGLDFFESEDGRPRLCGDGLPTARTGAGAPRDEELAALAREGHREAADELVRRYQDKAYRIAFRMSDGDAEEARELAQEAFLKCFRAMKGFRGDSSFYTWFFRILVNTVLDERRRKRRWKAVFAVLPWRGDEEEGRDPVEDLRDEGPGSDPAAVLKDRQLRRDVSKAVSALPDKQRMVFQLRVFEEMSLKEIAKVLNLAEGTVKSHLFRALKTVRSKLGDWAELDNDPNSF